VLVPPPRVHLTRYHGVFALHAGLRAAITPAWRGRGALRREGVEGALPAHVAMSGAEWSVAVQAYTIESSNPFKTLRLASS
jgi:hypothetical protein